MKIVASQFPELVEEKALPLDENIINTYSAEDVKRLKAARAAFR